MLTPLDPKTNRDDFPTQLHPWRPRDVALALCGCTLDQPSKCQAKHDCPAVKGTQMLQGMNSYTKIIKHPNVEGILRLDLPTCAYILINIFVKVLPKAAWHRL